MKKRALEQAGRGWHVFPLTPGSKRPIPGSRGQDDATTDPATIERMWQQRTFANIGIACEPSGLYVVDVDMNPWKGKTGWDTWEQLVAEHGHVDTYTVKTWSGGLQFYYRAPEGVRLTNTAGTGGSTGRGLGKDIDTRGNGYVVAAGSRVTEDGHTGWYEVERDGALMTLPAWIVENVAERERAKPVLAGPVALDDAVLERVQALADELRDAPVGEGNATAARLAYMTGQYVGAGQIDQDMAIDLLLQAVAGWSWAGPGDARTMDTTIMRQVMVGATNPRPWERPVAAQNGSAARSVAVAAAKRRDANAQTAHSVAELAQDDVVVAQEDLDAPEGVEGTLRKPADPVKESEQMLSDWATDLGQAHHLFDRLDPTVLHADGVGWHSWDGMRWAPVSKDHIANQVTRFYRSQFRAMLSKYARTEDEKFSLLAKAYKSFMGTTRIAAILKMLSVIDGVFADPDTLDTHPELLNTPAGVVNLRTGAIGPHDPRLLLTKITAGRYKPGTRHPDWDKALTALPPEQADYLQIRMGQAATGHNAKDVVFLVGHGHNGKSAYTTDGVFPALGDYAHMAQPTLISKGQGTGATPDRAGLRGVRFMLIEELPESHALSVEEIKRITDTSVITARFLNANPITYRATHSGFVTSNSTPAVAEVDHGTWRRLVLVNFPYTFVEKPEAEYERAGDPTLKRRISDGADGQHDAIVTWLVEGAMRYFADPMLVEIERRPLEVAEAIRGWQMEADRIMAYFTDRLEVCDDAVVARSDLFTDFVAFLQAAGHAKWSQETFLSRFRNHDLVRKAGIHEGQIRTPDDISRPPLPSGVLFSSARPPLPGRVRVFRGIRFRDQD